MRQWTWTPDMTGDGIVTIRDVWAWVQWLYFYPGDLAIYGMLSHKRLAQFLELTPDHYGGAVSGLISLFVWFMLSVLWLLVPVLFDEFRAKYFQSKEED